MQKIIAAEQINEGQAVYVQDGLARVAIDHVHKPSARAVDSIGKGQLAVLTTGELRLDKPKGWRRGRVKQM